MEYLSGLGLRIGYRGGQDWPQLARRGIGDHPPLLTGARFHVWYARVFVISFRGAHCSTP